MRDLLNGVFSFIGAESLTDDEWTLLDAMDLSSAYDLTAYKALDNTLYGRESVTTMRDRLKAYYLAKGVDIQTPVTGTSNIYIGDAL
jgi:hypothetical protein